MRIGSELAAISRRVQEIANGPSVPFSAFETLVGTGVTRQQPRREIDGYVRESAAQTQIDPDLIEAIIACESGFDPNATSRAGARGLMQLMPATAASLGVSNPYDPAQNVLAGAKYLRQLLDRFGDIELAVAAYNAGPGAVERYGGIPPFSETQEYVRSVLARYRVSKSARQR